MRRAALLAAALVIRLTGPAGAVEMVELVVPAPFERVWAAAARGLIADGWAIDHADGSTGTLVTESHRLAGTASGVHVASRRVRLRLRLSPVGEGRTVVAIGRELFERERVLWIDRDRHVVAADALAPPDLERRALAAIRKAL